MTKASALALVTGSGGGLGACIAKRLQDENYQPVIIDVNSKAVDKQVAELNCIGITLDISDGTAVKEKIASLVESHGVPKVLINNAGVHVQELLIDMTDQQWQKIINTNLTGTFNMCREVGRYMMQQNQGVIINVITKLGFGNPLSSAYMASKSAIWGMSLCFALEAAAHNVRVNCVAPGHIGPGTGMEQQFKDKAVALGLTWEEFEQKVWQTIPAGRWCKPQDVAAAVAYLISDEAQFVIGETLHVTGGFQSYAGTAPKSKQL